MAPTTGQWQLRRREAGWEGSRRPNRDPRYTNRIGGGVVWASRQRMAKPDAIKRPLRICGGCARKVAGLIPGGLHGCPRMPIRAVRRVRWVVRDGDGREVVARRGDVSRGRITSGIEDRWERPNAKPSAKFRSPPPGNAQQLLDQPRPAHIHRQLPSPPGCRANRPMRTRTSGGVGGAGVSPAPTRWWRLVGADARLAGDGRPKTAETPACFASLALGCRQR
jgi:hypothetical protein